MIGWIISIVAMWIVAVTSFVLCPKRKMNQWLSIFTFFSGIGSLSYCITLQIERLYHPMDPLYIKWDFVSSILSGLSHYFSPYSLMIFGLLFWEHYSGKKLHRFKTILLIALIPILIMYLVIPVFPHTQRDFIIVLIWAPAYCIIATVFIAKAVLIPSSIVVRIQKILLFILVSVPANYVMFTSYFFRAFGNNEAFKTNIFPLAAVLIVFLFALFRYGLWGIRLRLKTERMDISTKVLTAGTQMLNHAIKNEIAKVNLSMRYLKKMYEKQGYDVSLVQEEFDIVDSSIGHIHELINRIRNQVGEIEIKEEPFNLLDEVNRCINENLSLLNLKAIKIDINILDNIQLVFDPVHFKEVLNNIIKNALEASSENLFLKISLEKKSGIWALIINDNGKGMSRYTLEKILEPFFSTKGSRNNFGIGLTYCFNVMKKHGGDLIITSKEGTGTSVRLVFTKSKINVVQILK